MNASKLMKAVDVIDTVTNHELFDRAVEWMFSPERISKRRVRRVNRRARRRERREKRANR